MIGTHNPDTGRFSLGPNGWETDIQTGRQMFFVDGHHLRDPNRLSIRIITGSGNSSDEEIVVRTRLRQKTITSPLIHVGKTVTIISSGSSTMIEPFALRPALTLKSGLESWREE